MATTKKTAKKTTRKASKKAAKKTTRTAAARSPSNKTRLAKSGAKPAPKKPATRWTLDALMAELERLGTEQNRKIYARHGAPANMFGVSFANIYALQKQIKRDHDLALALWQTGNADAQTLAALIADPARTTRAELEACIKSAAWCASIDYLATFVATTPHAIPLAQKWMKSRDEFTRRAGYSTVSSLLKNGTPDAEPLDTAFLRDVLAAIEREIRASANRAREGMNTTLICIGVYHDPLHREAIGVAERIGFVPIDHGPNTSCKDFVATEEIAKARAYRAKKAAGAKRK